MLYEFRTYDLKPRSVPDFEQAFADKLPGRAEFSSLGGLWHTEAGPLNQVLHIWPYEDMDERNDVRAKATAAGAWPDIVADESSRNGYDFGIILNQQGKVTEISYACLYIVRDGVAITPPTSAGTLESITRDVVKQLLEEELGVPVVERDVDRTELYIADEAFVCGTGAEIQAIGSIDHYQLGDGQIGPVVSGVEQLYHDLVRGKDSRFSDWRTTIY